LASSELELAKTMVLHVLIQIKQPFAFRQCNHLLIRINLLARVALSSR
jgi:hypothetical protein